MSAVAPRARYDLGLFALAAIAVYAFEIWLARGLTGQPRADLLAVAIVVDLAILVPLVFGLAIVRRRRWPWTAVVPPAIVGLVIAGATIPEPHRGAVEWAHLAAVPLELGLIVWIGRQGWLAVRRARTGATASGVDFVEAMTESVRGLLGNSRLAAIAGYEASVLAYAFGAVPREPDEGDPAVARFTHHRTSAYSGFLLALSLVAVMELIGVHLLLLRVHEALAWAVTLLSIYAFIWVVADFRALYRRPTRLDDRELHLRLGLRWTVRIPWSRVTGLEPRTELSVGESPPPLTLRLVGAPAFRLRLDGPVEVHGFYGMHRQVETIDLAIDDAERFERLVRERLSESPR